MTMAASPLHPACDFRSAAAGSACFHVAMGSPSGEQLQNWRTQGRTVIGWVQQSLGVPRTLAWDQATVDALYARQAARGDPLDPGLVQPGAVSRELVEAAISQALGEPRSRVLVHADSVLPMWNEVALDDGASSGRFWPDGPPTSRQLVSRQSTEQDRQARPANLRVEEIVEDLRGLATLPNTVAILGYAASYWWLLGGPRWAGIASIVADIADNVFVRYLREKSLTESRYDWLLSGSVTALAASRLGVTPIAVPVIPIAQAYLRAVRPDIPIGSLRSMLIADALVRESRVQSETPDRGAGSRRPTSYPP